jgi:hypothetical protein
MPGNHCPPLGQEHHADCILGDMRRNSPDNLCWMTSRFREIRMEALGRVGLPTFGLGVAFLFNSLPIASHHKHCPKQHANRRACNQSQGNNGQITDNCRIPVLRSKRKFRLIIPPMESLPRLALWLSCSGKPYMALHDAGKPAPNLVGLRLTNRPVRRHLLLRGNREQREADSRLAFGRRSAHDARLLAEKLRMPRFLQTERLALVSSLHFP